MSLTTTKIVIARTDGTILGQYVLGLGEHLIGREEHCTIRLEDDHVSREYAHGDKSVTAVDEQMITNDINARTCD